MRLPNDVKTNTVVVPIVMIVTIAVTGLLITTLRAFGIDPAAMRYTNIQINTTTAIVGLSVYFVLIGFVFIVQRFIHREPISSFGFRNKALQNLALGFVFGLGIAFIAKAIGLALAQQVSFSRATLQNTSVVEFVGFHITSLIFLFLNSIHEELLFRAYPLSKFLSDKMRLLVFMLGLSLVFSLVHFMTSGYALYALTTRFLMGVLLSLVFITTHSIWASIGLHSGLNWVAWMLSGNWQSGALFKLSSTSIYGVAQYINSFVALLAIVVMLFFSNRRVRNL